MSDFVFRAARVKDIPFLIDTIIEAEKSGTTTLSYNTLFGLTYEETRSYLEKALMEEIDGCELSISSFLIAQSGDQIAGSVSAWIEGSHGISSSILKGNLLNYVLPKSIICKAFAYSSILNELKVENIPYSIQIGLVYVSKFFRGQQLARRMIEEQIRILSQGKEIDIYVQVFANNLPAIRAYENAFFKIVDERISYNSKACSVLPDNKKLVMKREFS